MTLMQLPAIDLVDIPTIRQRVPRASRQRVLDTIIEAMRTVPLDPTRLEPLQRELTGLYKCPFSSGLHQDEEDMRLAVFVDPDSETVVVWAVGFRDAYLPTDFYKLLRQRLQAERSVGTPGAFRIGRRIRVKRRRVR